MEAQVNISIFLHQGPADGEIRTLYKETAPLELRVAVNPVEGVETPEVAVYRVFGVETMEVAGIGAAASYVFQGTRPSAWSLVDFTVAR
jgi:hypothetical protein